MEPADCFLEPDCFSGGILFPADFSEKRGAVKRDRGDKGTRRGGDCGLKIPPHQPLGEIRVHKPVFPVYHKEDLQIKQPLQRFSDG